MLKSGDQVLALIYCYDWFPHSLNMAPKQQTWAQLVSWPPVTRSASDAELSMRVSLLILRLREVSSLSMGNYIQFGRSHESDFHGITQFGSKICHRSVTCVTCDICLAVCDKGTHIPPWPNCGGEHLYSYKSTCVYTCSYTIQMKYVLVYPGSYVHLATCSCLDIQAHTLTELCSYL